MRNTRTNIVETKGEGQIAVFYPAHVSRAARWNDSYETKFNCVYRARPVGFERHRNEIARISRIVPAGVCSR